MGLTLTLWTPPQRCRDEAAEQGMGSVFVKCPMPNYSYKKLSIGDGDLRA